MSLPPTPLFLWTESLSNRLVWWLRPKLSEWPVWWFSPVHNHHDVLMGEHWLCLCRCKHALSNRLSYFIPCQPWACACFRLTLYSQYGLLRSQRSLLHHNIPHHNRLSCCCTFYSGICWCHNHHTHLHYHGSGLGADSRHTVYQRFIPQDCRSADLNVAELSGADRSLVMEMAQSLKYILSRTSNGVQQVINCFTQTDNFSSLKKNQFMRFRAQLCCSIPLCLIYGKFYWLILKLWQQDGQDDSRFLLSAHNVR